MLERRNKNYVMAFAKIISGAIYVISMLFPYGTMYEAAWVRYTDLRLFQFGTIGEIIAFWILLAGLFLMLSYAAYLWLPRYYFVGWLKPVTKEKAKKVLEGGKVSVHKYRMVNISELAIHFLVILANVIMNINVSDGDTRIESSGPARYLMFLAAFIGIAGSVLGFLMANLQVADELDWWTAVREGQVDASGAFVNIQKKAAQGTGTPRITRPMNQAGPDAEQEYFYCPYCGTPCKSGTLFCKKCGAKIEE